MTSSLPTKGRHHALLAGFLGWTLDAFDFFVIVFLYDTLSQHFGVSKKAIIFTTTATLALRPVGGRCSGWARCRRCWLSTFGPRCRSRRRGGIIAPAAWAKCCAWWRRTTNGFRTLWC